MQNTLKSAFTLFIVVLNSSVFAQYPGWQQSADYTMSIDVDVDKHQYSGDMTILSLIHI